MPMFAECTKWQSWVCQFMVPSHALKHEGKSTCGLQGRKHLAGSYMGPSPLEQILPLQGCTWFLSSPSMGLNLTEFPMVHFRRRNMFPTATNSLWQKFHWAFHKPFHGLFGHRSCPVLALSVLAGSAGVTMKSYACTLPLTCFSQTGSIRSCFLWYGRLFGKNTDYNFYFLKYLLFISCC